MGKISSGGRGRIASEEFGGFDTAGGQMRDEFAVGGQEIVLREFAGKDPGDLFEDAGRYFSFGELGGKEVDFELVGRVGVEVANVGDGCGFG